MEKRDRKFEQVEKLKAEYRRLTSEKIRHLLSMGITIKEAAIAYKEVLRERGENGENV